MRLLNQVAQSRKQKWLHGKIRVPDPCGLRDRLVDCASRYVLEPDVTAFARELVLRQPDLLCSSLDFLRVPDELAWVEWSEDAWLDEPAFQIGMLIETDGTGRAGEIRVVFANKGDEPQVSPAFFHFDFDAAQPCRDAKYGFSMNHDALPLHAFFERVQGEIHPSWADYWLSDGGAMKFAREKAKLAQALWMVPTVLFAFFLILGANAQFDRRKVGYERLNRRRLKRGKPALFEHSEMRLKLFEPSEMVESDGIGGARRKVRLHHVRGHFVRRGDAIFWRKPHLRGDNDLALAPSPIRRVSFG